jgi:hypothetical protein
MSVPATSVTMTDDNGKQDALVSNPAMGGFNYIPLPSAISDTTHRPFAVTIDNNSMEDLWIALTWGKVEFMRHVTIRIFPNRRSVLRLVGAVLPRAG